MAALLLELHGRRLTVNGCCPLALLNAKMPHPSTILQLLESDDKIFIVMELAKYGPLDEFLCDKFRDDVPVPEDITLHIMKQIFAALNYLHTTKNIMHRDLKPENILVSDYNFESNSKKVYFSARCISITNRRMIAWVVGLWCTWHEILAHH